MKVYGLDKLVRFNRKHGNAKGAIEAWLADAHRADWSNPHAIKVRYSSVDFLARNKAIFNIKGNHYRLVVKVGYNDRSVMIEWIGTHAEYSKMAFDNGRG